MIIFVYYIAEHILGKKEPISYPVIPNLVFTLPRIAQVGVPVEAAEKEPDKYRVETVPYGKVLLFDAKNEVDIYSMAVPRMMGQNLFG